MIIVATRTFIIEPGAVNGRSMETTFLDDDLFFINKAALLFRAPRRGDVVQAKGSNPGEVIIKRVIGLPGERLSIHDGSVFLVDEDFNETLLNEPYLNKEIRTLSTDQTATLYMPIPEQSYFLLGDNRPMSIDSRVTGAFHRSEIYGLIMKLPF